MTGLAFPVSFLPCMRKCRVLGDILNTALKRCHYTLITVLGFSSINPGRCTSTFVEGKACTKSFSFKLCKLFEGDGKNLFFFFLL